MQSAVSQEAEKAMPEPARTTAMRSAIISIIPLFIFKIPPDFLFLHTNRAILQAVLY
jgi:hypothetical protein